MPTASEPMSIFVFTRLVDGGLRRDSSVRFDLRKRNAFWIHFFTFLTTWSIFYDTQVTQEDICDHFVVNFWLIWQPLSGRGRNDVVPEEIF